MMQVGNNSVQLADIGLRITRPPPFHIGSRSPGTMEMSEGEELILF